MTKTMALAGAVVLFSTAAFAQAPAAPAAAPQQDFSKVEIKTTKLAEGFYTLEGSGGRPLHSWIASGGRLKSPPAPWDSPTSATADRPEASK